jgi:hypothetical protein
VRGRLEASERDAVEAEGDAHGRASIATRASSASVRYSLSPFRSFIA